MTRLVWSELSVTNLLLFEHHQKAARQLSVFWTLWRNCIRQRLKEGCRKPVLGVCDDPFSQAAAAVCSPQSCGCESFRTAVKDLKTESGHVTSLHSEGGYAIVGGDSGNKHSGCGKLPICAWHHQRPSVRLAGRITMDGLCPLPGLLPCVPPPSFPPSLTPSSPPSPSSSPPPSSPYPPWSVKEALWRRGVSVEARFRIVVYRLLRQFWLLA